MKFLGELIIDDILAPVAMGLFLNILGIREFLEAAIFLSFCEMLSKVWIRRCNFVLIKETRQVSAPFIVPIPAMLLLTIFYPELDIQDFAYLGTNYMMYLIYAGGMAFLRPTLHLFFMGPNAVTFNYDDHE